MIETLRHTLTQKIDPVYREIDAAEEKEDNSKAVFL